MHLFLGLTYLLDSRFEDAIEEVKKAVALSPDDPELLIHLGFVYGMVKPSST
jgi:Flp pilus assembly protein TadD